MVNQLKTIFGAKADTFMNYEDCIWSHESNTFETSDVLLYPHQNNGNRIFGNALFDNKLIISSAESALESPGYMDGAVYAGNGASKKIIMTR